MAANWDNYRYFLEVGGHGSLSAAANSLHVSQSTVARRLAGLEKELGVRLLQKTPDAFVLTEAGEGILTRIDTINDEIHSIVRSISGRDQQHSGRVRVTSVEAFGSRFLTPHLCSFRESYPDITLEIITDFRCLNLCKREADVAIRFSTFNQHEIVIKRVGRITYTLYGARSYLKNLPRLGPGCPGHSVIAAYDIPQLPSGEWLGKFATKSRVAYRTNSTEAQYWAAVGGMGLACLPCYLGDSDNRLIRVLPPAKGPSLEIWLGVHRDNQQIPRIRVVIDFLSEFIKANQARLSGAPSVAGAVCA